MLDTIVPQLCHSRYPLFVPMTTSTSVSPLPPMSPLTPAELERLARSSYTLRAMARMAAEEEAHRSNARHVDIARHVDARHAEMRNDAILEIKTESRLHDTPSPFSHHGITMQQHQHQQQHVSTPSPPATHAPVTLASLGKRPLEQDVNDIQKDSPMDRLSETKSKVS